MNCPTLVLSQERCFQKQRKRTVHIQVLLLVQGNVGELGGWYQPSIISICSLPQHSLLILCHSFFFRQLFSGLCTDSHPRCLCSGSFGRRVAMDIIRFNKDEDFLGSKQIQRPYLLHAQQCISRQTSLILLSTFHYKRNVITVQKIQKSLTT